MNVLGLFSGIGGFELGFERADFTIAAMCEIEPYARAVLRKHWPAVPVFPDIRELTGAAVAHLGIDVITGGFPCQDISLAGKGAGIGGERSGLWREMHRVISEVRPRWAVIENVSALRSRGLEDVLGSLAAIGYDAEWHCIPASAVGAPHRRDRIWIITYPNGQGEHAGAVDAEVGCASKSVANRQGVRSDGRQFGEHRQEANESGLRESTRTGGANVADAVGAGLEGCPDFAGDDADQCTAAQRSGAIPDANSQPLGRLAIAWRECGQWLVEPDVGRVAYGIPARVDRLRALGNAVVPQIPEMIARAIITQS